MIKKNDTVINSVKEWEKYAGPKESYHWKEYRSAMESAKAWVEDDIVQIPLEIRNIFDGHKDFNSISSWEAEPEAKIKFDDFRGPSNMDLLVEAEDGKGKFIIGIEAKADETFSEYVQDKLTEGLEAKFESPESKKISRIEQLAKSLFTKKEKGEPKIGELRYQLLTGLAGTLAKAESKDCKRAVFVIHEFDTPLTTQKKHKHNQNDLNAFMHRLSSGVVKNVVPGNLYGPLKILGKPLFQKVPILYIGKAKRTVSQ